MVLHILPRLPFKSIARCHCLFKPWRPMLSHPHFFNTLNTKPQLHNLLVSKSGSLFSDPLTLTSNTHQVFDKMSEPATELNFNHQSHTWSKVLASFGGLVLVASFFNTLNTKRQQHNLLLVSKSGSLFSAPLTLTSNAHQVFDEMSEPATKLNFNDQSHTWSKVLASFGGLVLVSDNKDNIFLINPTTRQIKQLPPSPFAIEPVPKVLSPCGKYAIVKDNDGKKWFSYRMLPPSWYPVADHTTYALGYDSVNDDYKVVTLSIYEYIEKIPLTDVNDMIVNIYSVKNGTWTKADTFSYGRFVRHITSGVFVNGSIHWVASEDKHGHGEIVAFDLAHQKFHEVAHPPSIETLVIDSVSELGGCLCLTRDYSSSGTEVWILKEYENTESWTNFILADPEENYFTPLCLLGQEEMVLVKNPSKKCHSFVKYNMGKGTFKDIKIHGISEDFQAGGTFVESLVSPHYSHETC